MFIMMNRMTAPPDLREEFAEGHQRIGEFKDENGKLRLNSRIEKYEVFAC